MEAELIVVNAQAHTMNVQMPLAEAVAVANGRIVAVGENERIRGMAGPDTEQVDAAGRVLLPAFTDAHIHLVEYGRSLGILHLDQARSIGEVVDLVAAAAGSTPPGTWIRGLGWNRNLWVGSPFPTRESLDGVAPNHPVMLDSKDLHAVWVNSAALKLAGITARTPDPAGGVIVRDSATGEPTGVLKENPAIKLITERIPPPEPASYRKAISDATRELHRHGIAAVHVPEGRRELAAVMDSWQRRELELRVLWMVSAEDLAGLANAGLQCGFGDEWLRLGPVKAFADGALGSRTADMNAPYEGEKDNRGVEVQSTEQLSALVEYAALHNWSVAIHAIGDRANSRVLDALERHWRAWTTRKLRPRIEHVQLLAPEDLPRLGAMGIIASMQPIHCPSDLEMAEKRWGTRCSGGYAWRSLLESGARLAFGSDAPVEEPCVLKGLHAAITRQRENGLPAGGWYPEQRLSLTEAVECYTMGGAYAAGQERESGSLTAGKHADMILLSQDIFRLPPQELLSTQVDLTIINGEIVHEG